MSASRERKKRLSQVEQPAEVKETAKKKLSEGWIFSISVILVVVLVFGCLFGYRAYNANRTVLTVGDHKVSVSEFNYFYNSAVSSVSSYPSYLGIDTTLALDEQKVSESSLTMLGLFGIDVRYLADYTASNGYYDVTWAQLFAHVAMENAASIYAVYNEAEAAGFELTEAMLEEIEEAVEEMQGYADSNGESLNSLLERVYGAGCDEDSYREYLKVQVTVNYYPSELRFSEEELAACREESPEDYEVATYYLYTVSNGDYVEETEDGETPEPSAEETAKAKEAALAMKENFDTEDENVAIKADNTRSAVTSAISESAANWLFDEAAVGDVKLYTSDGTFYVLKLIDKSDYVTTNVLELVIEADHEHEEGEEVDHVHEEGELTAAEKLEKITTALDADATEETFRALVAEYSSNSQVEVTDMTRATMVEVSDEILAWSMEAHKVGDYKAFEVDGGTLILFYTGEGMTYGDTTATSVLANEHLQEISDAAVDACGYDEKAAMKGNVGLILTSN